MKEDKGRNLIILDDGTTVAPNEESNQDEFFKTVPTIKGVRVAHEMILDQTGINSPRGVRNLHLLESALGQPWQSFDGEYLYSDAFERAVTLGFGIIANHPFNDGNKRTGHCVMETLLDEYGYRKFKHVSVNDEVEILLDVARGKIERRWFNSSIKGFYGVYTIPKAAVLTPFSYKLKRIVNENKELYKRLA